MMTMNGVRFLPSFEEVKLNNLIRKIKNPLSLSVRGFLFSKMKGLLKAPNNFQSGRNANQNSCDRNNQAFKNRVPNVEEVFDDFANKQDNEEADDEYGNQNNGHG